MDRIVLEGGPAWLFLLVRLIEIGALIFMTVIWCLSMERAVKACDHSSRKIQIGQSYLIFIPLFGLVWQFIAVNKVSTTLATEYHFRGWKSDEGRPAIETGLIACVVIVVVFLLRFLVPDFNPGLAFLSTLGICICMYMHRERLNAFTERLEEDNKKIMQSFAYDNAPNPFMQGNFQQPYEQQWPGQPGQWQQNFPPQGQYQPQGMPQWQNAPGIPPVQSYVHQQYVQRAGQQHTNQQKMQREQEEAKRPGWDGVTVWVPPAGWQHPDLSDPSPYFNGGSV